MFFNIKRVFYLLLFLPLFFSGSKVHAATNDFGIWSPIYLQAPIKEKGIGYFEVNPRFVNKSRDADQLLIRPAFGFKLTDRLSIWQGYAWIHNYRPNFKQEHRIWQQLLYDHKLSKLGITHRFRLEERFLETADEVSIRARYNIRGTLPLSETWALTSYEELFVNLNSADGGPSDGIDQNRFFVGVRKKFTDKFTAETGYQLQHINLSKRDKLNHLWLTQFFYNL